MSHVEISNLAEEVLNESEDWDRTGSYPDEDLIQAYQIGVEKGRSENLDSIQRIVEKGFMNDLRTALRTTEELYAALATSKVGVTKVLLGVESVSEFRALLTLDENSFYSDKLDISYDLSFKIADQINDSEEDFEINFAFMKESDKINDRALEADGYLIRYEPKAKTRKSQSQRASK